MGQCYSVKLKLVPKKVTDTIAAFNCYVDEDTRSNWNLNRYKAKGYTLNTLDGCMTILLSDQCIERKGNTWHSDFEGSYGWGDTILDAFRAMSPTLKDGSEVIIYPDSGMTHLRIANGKVIEIPETLIPLYIPETQYESACETLDDEGIEFERREN